MKESEYIKATNRVKITAAIDILRSVLPGEKYGILRKDLAVITSRLIKEESKLFESYSCEED